MTSSIGLYKKIYMISKTILALPNLGPKR